ncbi:MAG: hypothetical protein EOO39_28995, partial [Cytophagaceae bacterium]
MENQSEEQVEGQSTERGILDSIGDIVKSIPGKIVDGGQTAIDAAKEAARKAKEVADAAAQAAKDAANAAAQAATTAANATANVATDAAAVVASGVVSTVNTVSNGMIGAANTVSNETLTTWKSTSDVANAVGYSFEATGLTVGQGMIDGADVVAKYGQVGVNESYKGLVAAGAYISNHVCDIALGTFLSSVFVALYADGEAEVAMAPLDIAVALANKALIKTASNGLAAFIVEPIFAIPDVKSAVGTYKGAFIGLLAFVIEKAASDSPPGGAGPKVAAAVIYVVTQLVCEGKVPAGGPQLWAGLQSEIHRGPEQADRGYIPQTRNYLRSGEFLTTGQYLASANGKYFM